MSNYGTFLDYKIRSSTYHIFSYSFSWNLSFLVSIFYLERRVRISLVPVLILHECSGPDEQDAGESGQERGQAEGSPGPQTEETVRGPGEGDSQRFGSVFVFYGSGSSLKSESGYGSWSGSRMFLPDLNHLFFYYCWIVLSSHFCIFPLTYVLLWVLIFMCF